MKYCYQCGKMTAGEPMYCATCGRTYDVKLCPRQHVNPRGVAICSRCGSCELSTPQPRIPMSVRLLAIVIRLGAGLLLFYLTLQFLIALLNSSVVRQFFIAIGMLLGVLWWMWTRLPDWLQEAIRELWQKERRRDED